MPFGRFWQNRLRAHVHFSLYFLVFLRCPLFCIFLGSFFSLRSLSKQWGAPWAQNLVFPQREAKFEVSTFKVFLFLMKNTFFTLFIFPYKTLLILIILSCFYLFVIFRHATFIYKSLLILIIS